MHCHDNPTFLRPASSSSEERLKSPHSRWPHFRQYTNPGPLGGSVGNQKEDSVLEEDFNTRIGPNSELSERSSCQKYQVPQTEASTKQEDPRTVSGQSQYSIGSVRPEIVQRANVYTGTRPYPQQLVSECQGTDDKFVTSGLAIQPCSNPSKDLKAVYTKSQTSMREMRPLSSLRPDQDSNSSWIPQEPPVKTSPYAASPEDSMSEHLLSRPSKERQHNRPHTPSSSGYYNSYNNPELSPNRRIMSGEYRVNRNYRPTRTHRNTDTAAISGSSNKDSLIEDSVGSFPPTPESLKEPRDGEVREGHRDVSRGSVTLSRIGLSRNPSRLILYGQGYGVNNSLVSLTVLSFICLATIFLAMQLLLQVNRLDLVSTNKDEVSLINTDDLVDFRQICCTLCIAVITLNVVCLMTCSLQSFLTAKLLKCPQGKQRAFKYLKECTVTRAIVVTGFFVSLPLFLIAVLFYVMLEFQPTSAVVGCILLLVGLVFTAAVACHNIYFWQREKGEANKNLPIFEQPEQLQPETIISQSELSTLV